jgi:hypothetical protein
VTHNKPAVEVVLLGDFQTVHHMDKLANTAAEHGATVTNVFSFEPGEAGMYTDATGVEAIVEAVACAIATGTDLWVPQPRPDLVHESHFRRVSLALQLHGRNLRFGPHLTPCPTEGGMNEADMALRAEVHAVHALDCAAMASSGSRTLVHEIEVELRHVTTRALRCSGECLPFALPEDPDLPDDSGTQIDCAAPDRLPEAELPWPRRCDALMQYARWLVVACGLSQAQTADCLNSAGQRTPTGRGWRQATVSRLVRGRYDAGTARS